MAMRAVAPQVEDDFDLFFDMLEAEQAADELYRPTNYWSHYAKSFIPELLNTGLADFRRRRGSVLASFAATDLDDFLFSLEAQPKVLGTLSRLDRMLHRAMRWNVRTADMLKAVIARCTDRPRHYVELSRYFFGVVLNKFTFAGLPISACSTTDLGNPEGLFSVAGHSYTLHQLRYGSVIADAARFIDISAMSTICELGPGLGRNIEILSKINSDATLLVFDIMPQLYVLERYLSTLYPERVVGYEQAVACDVTAADGIPKALRGKIVILPAWKMPEWRHIPIDLFWNGASFQEMEPHVVANYLSIVRDMNPTFIYVDMLPHGNYWGEWRPGQGGTKERVLASDVQGHLAEKYTLKATYLTDNFLFPYRPDIDANIHSYIFQHRT